MLEYVKQLEQAGEWAEIRRLAPALLADLHGDDLLRLHSILSIVYTQTAESIQDWNLALRHAHTCLRLAPSGSIPHVWALNMLACTYVDSGNPRLAALFANEFLRQVPGLPQLARFVPFVIRVQAIAAYHERRFLAAARLAERTRIMFERAGAVDQAARSALVAAWAYARAGRPQAAGRILPGEVPPSMANLLDGAKAAILAAEGRREEAIIVGQRALQGARLAHDYVEAAEVLLILAQMSEGTVAGRQALALTRKAAEFAARQDWDIHALLVLSDRAGGGELLHAHAAVARGSADLHDLGTYTTGVA